MMAKLHQDERVDFGDELVEWFFFFHITLPSAHRISSYHEAVWSLFKDKLPNGSRWKSKMAAWPSGSEIEKLKIRSKFRCDDEGSVVDELNENTSDSCARTKSPKPGLPRGTWWFRKREMTLLTVGVGQILSINETRNDDGPQDTQYRKLKVNCRNQSSQKSCRWAQ